MVCVCVFVSMCVFVICTQRIHHTSLFENLSIKELKIFLTQGFGFDNRNILWGYLFNLNKLFEKIPKHREYYEYLCCKDGCESQRTIEVDIPRTFPKHPYFRYKSTKDKLFRVLKAYSNHNPTIGYIQGLNFIAALLLFHFNEEMCFWCLLLFVDVYNTPQYYTKGLPKLRESVNNSFFFTLVLFFFCSSQAICLKKQRKTLRKQKVFF